MHIPKKTELATKKAVGEGLSVYRAREIMTGSEWADLYFYLSGESSLIQGRWETLPWQIGILNAMTNDTIREVFVKKSKRTGYTKMLLCAVGYYIDFKSRKVCIWQPVDGDAEEFSKVELDTMIRDVAPVRDKFPDFEKKSKYNTVGFKQFTGTPLYIRGGKSGKNYRRMTLDVSMLDELSAFDADIDGEGTALKLAQGRTEGSPFAKLVAGSTPKIKGECQIDSAFNDAEHQLKYHWPCPHCDTMQPLLWGGRDTEFGLKWESGKPETVVYQCSECSEQVSQNDFTEQLPLGRWQDESVYTQDSEAWFNSDGESIEAPRSVGFHIWAGYSPLTRWTDIVREWLEACRDPLKTKTFINTVLGDVYDTTVGDKADSKELSERPKHSTYDATNIPDRVVYVTAGVDVQADRFEVQIIGWGAGAEAFVLEYLILPCDTSRESSWESVLHPEFARTYQHPGGETLSIMFIGVDTGFETQNAYKYCKAHEHEGRLALKGMNGDRPIIPLRPSLNWKLKGLKGWIIGVDTAKTLLYNRLNNLDPGEGYVNFPNVGLPADYFQQLTAERRITKVNKHGRYIREWWKPPGARVEALDTFVYAMAALEHSGVDLRLAYERLTQSKPDDDFISYAKMLNE